jgi:dCMP deaminase
MTEEEFNEALCTRESKQGRYDQYFLNRCFEASGMSYCKRLQVGAVVVRDNRTILDGWNGTVPGQDNCCEDSHGKTKPTVIHAERNIIFYAARKGIPLEGATMYITHSPCIGCAQAMAAAGITRVVYVEDYKTAEGTEFLSDLNINVVKVEVEWKIL